MIKALREQKNKIVVRTPQGLRCYMNIQDLEDTWKLKDEEVEKLIQGLEVHGIIIISINGESINQI